MNIDDLDNAVKQLDTIGPGTREDPVIDKAIETLRKQVLKRGKKKLFDDLMLEGLVNLIEIHGMSQKQAFKAAGQNDNDSGRSRRKTSGLQAQLQKAC